MIGLSWFAFLLTCCHTMPFPIDSQATPETQALYQTLHAHVRKKLLLGHQNAYLQGAYWTSQFRPDGKPDFTSLSQRAPAIAGFDFGNFKDTDGLPFALYLSKVKQAHRQGALITFSWHMYHPATGQKPGTKPKSLQNAIKRMLPGGNLHQKYLAQLTKIVHFARRAVDHKKRPIPILFRPFHEQNGDWFWWSQTTHQDFIKLWRWTVRYLRDTQKIHQFLYVFSPSNQYQKRGAKDFFTGYPGHKFVDIFGIDCYTDHIKTCLPRLREIAAHAKRTGKLAALTEFGSQHSHSLKRYPSFWTDRFLQPLLNDPLASSIIYAMFWRNASLHHFYIPYPSTGILPAHPSAANFLKMVNHPRTATAHLLRHSPIRETVLLFNRKLKLLNQKSEKKRIYPETWPISLPSLLIKDTQQRLHLLSYGSHNALHTRVTKKAKIAWKRSSNLYRWPGSQGQRMLVLSQKNKMYQLQLRPRKSPHSIHTQPLRISSTINPDSDLYSYAWLANGSEHFVYRMRREIRMWWHRPGAKNQHSSWQLVLPIKKQSPSFQPIGTPLGWGETGKMIQTIITRTQSGHVWGFQNKLDSSTWKAIKLTANTPSNALPHGPLSAYRKYGESANRFVYHSRNGHIQSLHFSEQRHSWIRSDLHQETGISVLPVGQIFGHNSTFRSTQFIAFRDNQGQIQILFKRKNMHRWSHLNLSLLAKIQGIRASGSPVMFDWKAGKSTHLFFQSKDGNIHELWYSGQRWLYNPLSLATGLPRMLNIVSVLRTPSYETF